MKNLFKIFGFVAIFGLFAACSSDDDASVGKQIAQSLKKSSEVYFIPNVKARGCDVNGNMWESKPAMVTAEEVAEKKKGAVGVRGIKMKKKDELEKVYLFEEGKEIKRSVGLKPKDEIKKMLGE